MPVGPARRRPARWPGRPVLAGRLREVLRREFGAADAWVVQTSGRCRLEARVGWRTVVLLEAPEETFWTTFYASGVRQRNVDGTPIAQEVWVQRSRAALVEILRPLWARHVACAPDIGPSP